MSYSWNMQALILSRLDEIHSDKIGLLASDGKVTANRTILRLVSTPVHTKLVENPDLTILDMKHHKKANIDSLLHLINGGKIAFNEDINNLAEELEIHLTKSFKVDTPEVPEENPEDKDPGLVELKDGRFSCGLCFKAFSRKQEAKRHYKDIHLTKAKGGKNFSCKLPGCDKKFGNARYMKEHMRTKHGISAKMIPSTSKPKTTKQSVKKPEKPSKKLMAVEPQNIDVKEESADMMEESADMMEESIDIKEEPIED